MSMQTNLEALIEAAKHLSDEERKKLVEALHPSSDAPQPRHITEMRGLGKDLWRKIDSQNYLNAERGLWATDASRREQVNGPWLKKEFG